MIKLFGSAISPYYNKVKIALLEKGVNFEEVPTAPSQAPEMLEKSPMGKIPFVEIGRFRLAESTAIVEWLEDAYPTASLLPPTPNGRALSREIMMLFDLYVAQGGITFLHHRLRGSALDAAASQAARQQIVRGLSAVGRVAAAAGPYLLGEDFGYADLAAASALPLVTLASEVLGEDLLQHLPGADEYLAALKMRQTVAKTWAERDKAMAARLEKNA